uniref:SAP domain-containing protein n=1 Tax=viral metagenome TaxID=1070528 RepID=A0A6C0HHY9_9ZZZZ
MTNAMSKPVISSKNIHPFAEKIAYNIISKYTKGELTLKSCKIPDLKEIARYYKIRISGSKTELIERIELYFKKTRVAILFQSLFRGHLVRFSIKLRGCALKKRTMCVNDSDFYTMDPLNEIDHNDFYSYVDKQGFIYGFSVSSLIALFKRKGNITNPYNREKLDFKTMNEIFILYKLNNILYPKPPPPIAEKPVVNQVVQVASLPGPASPAQPGAPPLPEGSSLSGTVDNSPLQSELRLRMTAIQSKATNERIRELFMEMDQLGNYTHEGWFTGLTDRGLVHLFRYLYDIWTYRGQLTRQTKNRICSLQDPFHGIANLQTVELDELRKHCLRVMEYMVYTGVDIEFRRIGTLHVLSAFTLVSLPARQAMYWLYEGLV